MSTRTLLSSALVPFVLACVVAALVACGGESAEPAQADVYQVRGKVVSVSGSGEDARATVAHEAIPAFKDRKGNPSDMAAMTMAFGLGPNVQASALSAGKPYQLTFDVVWTREPALRITAATPLPEDTALTLAE